MATQITEHAWYMGKHGRISACDVMSPVVTTHLVWRIRGLSVAFARNLATGVLALTYHTRETCTSRQFSRNQQVHLGAAIPRISVWRAPHTQGLGAVASP